MKIRVIAGTFILVFQFSAASAKQLELDCTADLEHFCGGWTVTWFDFGETDEDHPAEDHLKINHRFVIGTRGGQIWLFPRRGHSSLEEGLNHPSRWNNQVRLVHVYDDEQNQTCLAGDVKVRTGHQDPGEWHRFIITSKIVRPDVRIGHERRLELEMFDKPIGQDLEDVESCDAPDSVGGLHNGVAHVED